MLDEAFADRQAAWSRVLVASLVDAGVEDIVVSPGSRSTPFVLAVIAERRLRLHTVIDERSAGFFALGLARVEDRPPLLLCTSGSALANYMPAVVEASASHLPLLLLTADRPFELHDCGANQTLPQVGFFGRFARAAYDVPTAEDSEHALRALRRLAAQAVFGTRWPTPGPVQLNARARKPFEPVGSESALLDGFVGRLLRQPIPRPCGPERRTPDSEIEHLAATCASVERGLIIAGPAPVGYRRHGELVAELSRRTGFPILAEVASQLRVADAEESSVDRALWVDGFDALFRLPAFADSPPELVIQIGTSPTSKSLLTYLRRHAGFGHWVLAEAGWRDAESTATSLLFSSPGEVLERLLDRLSGRRQPSAWNRLFATAAWRETVHEVLATGLHSVLLERDRPADRGDSTDGPLSEPIAVRIALEALPTEAGLMVGNSLSIRHVDLWAPGRPIGGGVFHQRGASGIDGLVAGAVGAAVGSLRPLLALLGDVSLLHDIGSLHLAADVETPLVVLVTNNDGGRIFEHLPIARRRDELDLWTTPHGLHFEHAADLYGLAYRRVDTGGDLRDALREGFERAGTTVVEAVVPPHGAYDLQREVMTRLLERTDLVALGPVPPRSAA